MWRTVDMVEAVKGGKNVTYHLAPLGGKASIISPFGVCSPPSP